MVMSGQVCMGCHRQRQGEKQLIPQECRLCMPFIVHIAEGGLHQLMQPRPPPSRHGKQGAVSALLQLHAQNVPVVLGCCMHRRRSCGCTRLCIMSVQSVSVCTSTAGKMQILLCAGSACVNKNASRSWHVLARTIAMQRPSLTARTVAQHI